jgi:hypothetical protein
LQAGVRAFTHAVGVGISDERALKHCFNDLAQGMMHDPVAKRRGGN